MGHLKGPLKFLTTVKLEIERGNSVQKGVQVYLGQTRLDSANERIFVHQIMQWLSERQRGQTIQLDHLNIYRRTLLSTLDRGLNGESIYQHLNILELEFIELYEDALDRYLGKLPFLLLLPLLLLQLPAFLLLLFGPIINELINSLH